MPRTTLTRRVRFAAAHRYRRPEWSDERNVQVFGACANPNFHGHSYECHVTVSGDVNAETGFAVNLVLLDEILEREVKQRFDHRNINLDVPEFGEGKLMPTGENLARFIFEAVQKSLGNEAQVDAVSIAEDDTMMVRYARD